MYFIVLPLKKISSSDLTNPQILDPAESRSECFYKWNVKDLSFIYSKQNTSLKIANIYYVITYLVKKKYEKYN